MKDRKYYMVTLDIESFGTYSLDQIEYSIQKALDEHIDLPNISYVRVASVSYPESRTKVKTKIYGKCACEGNCMCHTRR